MSGGMVLVDVSGKASTVMSVKGDMIDFDTARQRLPIGSTSDVLTVQAGLPAWVASSGGATVSTLNVYLTSDFSTTENTATILTGMTFDLPTISGGKCLIAFSNVCFRSTAGGIQNYIATDTSGSDVVIAGTGRGVEVPSATVASNPLWNMGTQAIHDADGSTITIYCWTGGGTLTYKGDNTYNKTTSMSALCVG
tara:strand:- start:222 stop:806 length:585 start_codon:yes stop_codon:yes gene_type:complete